MTKIVATIGPSSWEYSIIKKLLIAGVNCVRINASHGDHEQYRKVIENVRRADKELNRFTAIQLDNQGPKLRLGELPDEGVKLKRNQIIKLCSGSIYNQKESILPTQHNLSKIVSENEIVYLRDGLVKLIVTKVNKGIVEAKVIVGGEVFSRHGINLPDSDLRGEILKKKDLADIDFAIKNDVNQIALSFVQSANDVKKVRNIVNSSGGNLAIVAKIETQAAITNIEDIVKASDGLLIARGDLAYETRPEDVPIYQKKIIALSRKYRKYCIVATQMLESMTHSLQPTRAEVSDVANAVVDQADAVMLSGETASGEYPVETVRMMKKIILSVERADLKRNTHVDNSQDVASINQLSTAAASMNLASNIGAKVLISETLSGRTARYISSLRVKIPQIVTSPDIRTLQACSLLWGTKMIKSNKFGDGIGEAIEFLKATKYVKGEDWVVRVYAKDRNLVGAIDTITAEQVS